MLKVTKMNRFNQFNQFDDRNYLHNAYHAKIKIQLSETWLFFYQSLEDFFFFLPSCIKPLTIPDIPRPGNFLFLAVSCIESRRQILPKSGNWQYKTPERGLVWQHLWHRTICWYLLMLGDIFEGKPCRSIANAAVRHTARWVCWSAVAHVGTLLYS